MKNKGLTFFLFISIVVCQEFDLSIDIYSDVYSSNVLLLTKRSNKPDYMRSPIRLTYILSNKFM